jgi:hypothetical protein
MTDGFGVRLERIILLVFPLLTLPIGIYLLAGAAFNWRCLIYGHGMHGARFLLGEKGTRWMYGGLGALLTMYGLVGLGLMVLPMMAGGPRSP